MGAPDERERVTRHSYDNEMSKGEIEFAVDRKPPSNVRGRGGGTGTGTGITHGDTEQGPAGNQLACMTSLTFMSI